MSDHDDDFSAQWRRFETMARQGWDRLSGLGSADNTAAFGKNLRMGRRLAAGDVRLLALYLIEQQPRHGYDLIKAIETHSHGFYAPSPGMIYPALTYLEEAGFVSTHNEANKKLYTITPQGVAHLDDNRDAIKTTLDFLAKAGERLQQFRDMAHQEWHFDQNRDADPAPRAPHQTAGDRDIKNVRPEVNEARRALKIAIAEALEHGDKAQRETARIMRRAAEKIARLTHTDIDL